MKNWFSNLKFRYKLLIGMIAITTAALLLISQLSYSYFYKRNTREVLKKAEQSVETAGAVLSSQFQSLSAATNNLLVRKPFPITASTVTPVIIRRLPMRWLPSSKTMPRSTTF